MKLAQNLNQPVLNLFKLNSDLNIWDSKGNKMKHVAVKLPK